jgi:SAM-dependent methyltransferase
MIDRQLNYGREVIEDFLRTLSPFSDVLDIGAGSGVDLAAARRQSPTANTHAIELFRPAIQHLKTEGATVHSIDIERDVYPFADESLDVVMSNQVLEHTKDIFWIFHETSRVLKVGGHLILGVPNIASLHSRIQLAIGQQPSAMQMRSAHVRGFTKPDVMKFLEACFPSGYALERFAGSNFYPFPPLMAKLLAAAFPSLSWAIFLLLRKTRSYDQEFLAYPIKAELETSFYLGAGHQAIAKRAA